MNVNPLPGSAARSERSSSACTLASFPVPRPDAQDELVDPVALTTQPLGGLQRSEQDREVRLRPEVGARGGDDEVLRRERLTHVAHRRRAREAQTTCRGQPVVLGEVALQLDHQPPFIGRQQRAPAHGRQLVDTRLCRHADDPARDDDAPAPV